MVHCRTQLLLKSGGTPRRGEGTTRSTKGTRKAALSCASRASCGSFPLLFIQLLRAHQKFCTECGAIDLCAPQVDLVDLVRIGDVFEWIRVQYDEVGLFAGSNRAHSRQT